MIKFDHIKDLDALSFNLKTTREYLLQVLDSPILQYEVKNIPKRGSSGYRTLFIANFQLRSIHKIIRDDLSKRAIWPEYVHGFVKKRSIVTNAKLHLSKKVILNIDIKSYYESITKAKVRQVFKCLGANDEISDMLAGICTCKDYLIPGTVCAPVISNLIFAECDKELLAIATKNECSYSRYVDDITFSGEIIPSIKEVDKVLTLHGFVRNAKKTIRQFRGRKQYVTGLTVFDGTIPRIPKWKKEEFRKAMYFMAKYGIDEHLTRIGSVENSYECLKRFRGLICFYRSIEPCFVSKYTKAWKKIISDFIHKNKKNRPKDKSVFLCDF